LLAAFAEDVLINRELYACFEISAPCPNVFVLLLTITKKPGICCPEAANWRAKMALSVRARRISSENGVRMAK
jgi:hypothetical protein